MSVNLETVLNVITKFVYMVSNIPRQNFGVRLHSFIGLSLHCILSFNIKTVVTSLDTLNTSYIYQHLEIKSNFK